MAIKPIEKTSRAAMFAKIGLLLFVIGAGFFLVSIKKNNKAIQDKAEVLSIETERVVEQNAGDLAGNLVEQSRSAVGVVLGEATDMVGSLASYSASTVSNFVIDKATAPLIDQINKLPPIQQEEIKKNICK